MIRRLNKIANFPKFTYGLNIPIKIPYDFFAEIDNLILKFTLKFKGPKTARTILKTVTKWRIHTSQYQNFKVSVNDSEVVT